MNTVYTYEQLQQLQRQAERERAMVMRNGLRRLFGGIGRLVARLTARRASGTQSA